MGDPVGSGCQQLVWQALSEGGHDVQTAVPPQAGSSGSRRSSSAGSNCNGSTVGSGAAAAPGHSGGSSCPVPMIAAALLPSRGAAPAGSANGGRGPDSGSWRPQQQFHTAAELLSPPSTCKAARGSRGAAGRGRDVAHLARPLSEEMLTGACVLTWQSCHLRMCSVVASVQLVHMGARSGWVSGMWGCVGCLNFRRHIG
jgi:hypothetical protein